MSTTTRIRYGNLTAPGMQGLFGIPLPLFLASLAALVITLFLFVLAEWWVGLLAGVVCAVLMAPAAIRVRHGRTLYQRLGLGLAGRRARASGANRLVAGPAGRTADGTFRLPGIAAQSEVSDHLTAFGLPFAVVRIPSTDHYSVVLEAHPTGNDVVDQQVVDSQVAQWAAWLTLLGQEDGIVGASVTVETSVDSGLRLRRSVLTPVHDEASEFGKAVAGEVAGGFGASMPAISTRVTITFSGKVEGKSRPKAAVVEDIANRLPELMDGLGATGAGSHVRPSTSQDLTDYVRTAYDPSVAADIERARAGEGTGLSWHDAGPAFHEVAFDHYLHDRAVSMVWTLGGLPRGTFYDTSLKQMLSPDKRVARKRVTLLYRPIPASRTSSVVDRRERNATMVSTTGRTKRGANTAAARASQQTADEEAAGAGLVLFGMVVTATALNSSGDLSRATAEDLKGARQMITSQSAKARLRLRVALNSSDSAFVAGLPLGIVLPEHTRVPASLTDGLI
ncbi:SCO6880 family protein [Brachybacterium sp. J144]|uniref:SCO6880 family protein n=1 Tax=Brachybacterium sp. J144 TaxID=3116487 RepID=UPI002E77DC2C|nr:SCO6880 family protein [Brachybacterium sp. J144]MEE1652165.1 SCO6880 family protein [Brachybacterium sp. J144]